MYVDAPFLSVFVKFVVYLLFHPENISSKVDVIENASFNQIKIVIMLVKKKYKTSSWGSSSAIICVKREA